MLLFSFFFETKEKSASSFIFWKYFSSCKENFLLSHWVPSILNFLLYSIFRIKIRSDYFFETLFFFKISLFSQVSIKSFFRVCKGFVPRKETSHNKKATIKKIFKKKSSRKWSKSFSKLVNLIHCLFEDSSSFISSFGALSSNKKIILLSNTIFFYFQRNFAQIIFSKEIF